MRNSNYNFFSPVFLPLIFLSLPRKIRKQCRLCPKKLKKQCRLCPAKSQSLCSSLREITKPLFFAPRNYKAMQTLPRKNNRDIVSGAEITTEFILKLDILLFFCNYFCKSMVFQRSMQPLETVFKEKIFCFTVP